MVIASILISSFNRISLFRRTLWSIANNPPDCSFEVIVADEQSTDDILGELRKYTFPFKFIAIDMEEFTKKTGITKYHNNPSLSNNVAFNHSEGSNVFLMGNECIATKGCFNRMLSDSARLGADYIVFSTTFDVPQEVLNELDEYGTNLNSRHIMRCATWPLASDSYHSDVTNYISLTSRYSWDVVGGYDERYLGGIACEDSDFVRRLRTLHGFQLARSSALSLHQFHGGKTRYYEPTERQMSPEKWQAGLDINRKIYHAWDGGYENKQPWKTGRYGIKDIVKENY